ncbi:MULTISPECIES: transposase [Psychrilyobacter]|uniref:transposase n=1 Tax=Psychrilyobacter TaxID=623282 RepID=UPI0034E1D346
MTIGDVETSKLRFKELASLSSIGVKEIFIVSVGGFSGFKDAINIIYPETKTQLYILHQIRNTVKFLNYKKRKTFERELKGREDKK